MRTEFRKQQMPDSEASSFCPDYTCVSMKPSGSPRLGSRARYPPSSPGYDFSKPGSAEVPSSGEPVFCLFYKVSSCRMINTGVKAFIL